MRVGVILAARAPVPYLAEALESVLSQQPAPDEVVVVDHASSPALGDLAGARVVRVDSGAGGPAEARAAGLAELDCDLVALADADDVWEPGKLAAQLEALAAHPEAAVCFGRARVVDARGLETRERLPELPAGLLAPASLAPQLYARNAIPAASAVIRREALESVGGFESADGPLLAASDWDLWLRLAAAGHAFVCEPKARIRYRRHAGALTADIARLGAAGLEIHRRHVALVDPKAAADAQATDLETLARGRIRERRYREARDALTAAEALRRPTPRERALRAATRIPFLRSALGRRNPFNNRAA